MSSGHFSVVRTPGKLSCGEFSVRTGRQTPVDGAGRPAVGGFRCKRLRFCRKTDEVVLLKGSAQTIDTAGGSTSSDLAALGHLTLAGSLGPSAPLNRSLRSLGKALGRGSSYSCSLFPVPCSLVSSPNQNFPPTEHLPLDTVCPAKSHNNAPIS